MYDPTDTELVVFLSSAGGCSLATSPGNKDNWIERTGSGGSGGKLPNYTCPTPGCLRPSRAKTQVSLCTRCQASKHQGRIVGVFRRSLQGLTCTVPSCSRPQYAHDLCNMHYQRVRAFGFTGSAESLRVMWRDLGLVGRPGFLNNRDFDVPDSLEGVIERAEYEAILHGDPCVFCGSPMTDIDHVVPFSRGGSSEWDNLAPTCRSCNVKKFTWSLLDFLYLQRMSERV